jgi:hypothetical protein
MPAFIAPHIRTEEDASPAASTALKACSSVVLFIIKLMLMLRDIEFALSESR